MLMARRVTPGQTLSPYQTQVPAHQVTMTGEEDGGGGSVRGYVPLAKKDIVSPRPQSSGLNLAECFKLTCGEKGRSAKEPQRIEPPPSELFFKNGVRALWADKHCPRSLSGFQCHAQQTQQMKQLVCMYTPAQKEEAVFLANLQDVPRKKRAYCSQLLKTRLKTSR